MYKTSWPSSVSNTYIHLECEPISMAICMRERLPKYFSSPRGVDRILVRSDTSASSSITQMWLQESLMSIPTAVVVGLYMARPLG